jgi:hypothetical protein
MRIRYCLVPLVMLLASGCNSPFSSSRAAAVEKDVRVFAGAVARDVTHDGPAAWNQYFADTPAFFMAVNGQLVFPDHASAAAAMPAVARRFKQIALTWGNDLRVDALSPTLAILGASYHETRVSDTGERTDENGFFTGTAESREGRWQFRNVHWSVAASPPAVR